MHSTTRRNESVGIIAAIVCFVLSSLCGQAQQAPQQPVTPPEAIPLAVQAFGRDHFTCLEWSDSCIICQRDGNGMTHCSTPAIACLPQAIVCRREQP